MAVPKAATPNPQGDTGGSVVATPLERTPGQPPIGPTTINMDPAKPAQPGLKQPNLGPQGELPNETTYGFGGPRKNAAGNPKSQVKTPMAPLDKVKVPPPPGGVMGAPPLGGDTRVGNNDGYPLGLRRDPVIIAGRSYSREPSALESRIFNFSEIPDRLDYERDALVRRLHAIRLQQRDALISDLVARDASSKTADFTDWRPDATSMPLTNEVYLAIRAAQSHTAAYGAQQVRSELAKQGHDVTTLSHETDAVLLADRAARAAANKKKQLSSLVSSAQTTSSRLNNQWQNTVIEAGIRIRRTGVQGEELADKMRDELGDDAADAGLARAAGQEVNEAFSQGRDNEADTRSDQWTTITRSAILDAKTCDHCADMDGTEWKQGDPDIVDTPDPDCEGNDSCRCVNLWT